MADITYKHLKETNYKLYRLAIARGIENVKKHSSNSIGLSRNAKESEIIEELKNSDINQGIWWDLTPEGDEWWRRINYRGWVPEPHEIPNVHIASFDGMDRQRNNEIKKIFRNKYQIK